jgi:hypothetical protein
MPLIHTYQAGAGGIGDFLRSVYAYFVYCNINNIKYYLNLGSHPFSYCFGVQTIPQNHTNNLISFMDIGGSHTAKTLAFLNAIKSDNNYIVVSNIFDFVSFQQMKQYREKFLEFLHFTPIVYKRVEELNKIGGLFNAIHVRCGDKFMNVVNIPSDERVKPDQVDLSNAIKFLNDLPIVLFSDTPQILKKYSKELIILDQTPQHTALNYGTNDAYINTVSEFLILSSANRIVSLTNSGFSFWAAFLFNKPLYSSELERVEGT